MKRPNPSRNSKRQASKGPSEFWNRLFPYKNMNALDAVEKLGKKRKK